MKKALVKRTADVLEKIGVGAILVGLFQNKPLGIWIGLACLCISYALTAWEAKL